MRVLRLGFRIVASIFLSRFLSIRRPTTVVVSLVVCVCVSWVRRTQQKCECVSCRVVSLVVCVCVSWVVCQRSRA